MKIKRRERTQVRSLCLFHKEFPVFCQDTIPLEVSQTKHGFAGLCPGHRSILGGVVIGLTAVVTPGQDGSRAGIVKSFRCLNDIFFSALGIFKGLNPNIVVLAELVGYPEIFLCALVGLVSVVQAFSESSLWGDLV